jgi:SNF2 family DNA or RNA helicase
MHGMALVRTQNHRIELNFEIIIISNNNLRLKQIYSIMEITECIPEALLNRMYPHQKSGVEWMLELFHQSKGGILGG